MTILKFYKVVQLPHRGQEDNSGLPIRHCHLEVEQMVW